MALQMDECEAPTSTERIAELEKQLAIQLPEDYRRFLLAHNGGRPNLSVFLFHNARGGYSDSCVDWFLAVDGNEYHDFQTLFERTKRDRIRIPPELVAIAHDPGGNLICIAITGPSKGAVYFWDHENEADDGQPPDYENVHLIANSFSEFISSLSDAP